MKKPRTGTNNAGIESAIKKAVARADWYEKNYKEANDFQKRKKKQFWGVILKFLRKHELTDDQSSLLHKLIPEEYRLSKKDKI
jgi:hypothetical protein